jgi:predicted nucleic acid-binding protein
MILVDSSVWIDSFRNETTAQVGLLRNLDMEDVIIGDLVLLEVLRGVRSDREALVHESNFREIGVTAISSPDMAIAAASNCRKLRGRGISIRSVIDVLIATYCIAHNHQLLHDDRDFDHFERHFGLKVLRAEA